MVLGQFAPLNSRRLSQLMDVNPGTISVYVQRLVKKGLVQRERDTADRRNWWLTLTDLGQAADVRLAGAGTQGTAHAL